MSRRGVIVGVDVGGTFTDLVSVAEDGTVRTAKVLSTPADQSEGVERSLRRGDVLFHEGDPPDSLYLVLEGRIAIAMASPVDHRESVVALMEPGDLFARERLDVRGRQARQRLRRHRAELGQALGPARPAPGAADRFLRPRCEFFRHCAGDFDVDADCGAAGRRRASAPLPRVPCVSTPIWALRLSAVCSARRAWPWPR